jgi:NACalpha-BTF3-like transcription factor
MTVEVTSKNPVVQAVVSGSAPPQARMAAARGLLPLAQEELLELLVALRADADAEVARAADETLSAQEPTALSDAASVAETPPPVLAYLATRADLGRAAQEAVALNASTPDDAIVELARATGEGSVLEVISINQQRLIRTPQIIDAVLSNPARTPDSERRVRETRREFFEKERGARQVAEELRARGMDAAAEFFEEAESVGEAGGLSAEDAWLIAQHIEVSDEDIDDSWLPSEWLEELIEDTFEQREAAAARLVAEATAEAGAPERVALIRRIMLMKVKDRMKLGMKGDREARSILIRDSNRIVAQAVINNPRITDQEVEAIAAMRTVSDEVLRIIAMNRAWARQYPIIHNLARNPRTPLPTAMTILLRLQTKDLKNLSQNRNVPEAIRRQALRLSSARGQ